ncbi:hypothetical protein OG866_01340 [Streptomyces sp. NBC_00663]|uniref:hypothetical protein n=1 Tax=Streptomyces sp. NBC_00663 TaxID=2975801 RepID=UPI002E349035|nr:hypothetical protein [Streptomyces sp. NBC_00663]
MVALVCGLLLVAAGANDLVKGNTGRGLVVVVPGVALMAGAAYFLRTARRNT